jgi:hypothetical protein
LNLKVKAAIRKNSSTIRIKNSKHMKTLIKYLQSENVINFTIQKNKPSICFFLKYNAFSESSLLFLQILNQIQKKLNISSSSVKLQQNQCNDILFLNSYETLSKHGKAIIKIK